MSESRGSLIRSVFFFKQKTAYEMRISDWSSDVCSSDLIGVAGGSLLQIESSAILSAYAFPAVSEITGSGTGGDITLRATGGGQVTILNKLSADASGGSLSTGGSYIPLGAGSGTERNCTLMAVGGPTEAVRKSVFATTI